METIDYSVNMGHNDFRTQILTVEELIYRFDETDATSSVSSFRRPTTSQSSRIIESLLLGMPQPMLFVDASRSGFVVVEGAEHLYAYYSFCKKGMALSSLYFKKKQYEGRTFYDLSPLAQSNILNAKITVNVLNPGLMPHERFGVYLCLKPRLDSASISWCRSKIYPNEFQWIKDLARRVSMRGRTDTLESAICYMLVGCYYQSFLNSNSLHQIDAVANHIMEYVYHDSMKTSFMDDFESIIKSYLRFTTSHVVQPKVWGLYLSVFYHLYKRNGDFSMIKRWDVHMKSSVSVNSIMRDDSAEYFCRKIDEILSRF